MTNESLLLFHCVCAEVGALNKNDLADPYNVTTKAQSHCSGPPLFQVLIMFSNNGPDKTAITQVQLC